MFKILAAISALVGLAFLVLWVRSYSRVDGCGTKKCDPARRTIYGWSLKSERGSILFGTGGQTFDGPGYDEKWLRETSAVEAASYGFDAYVGHTPTRRTKTLPQRLGFEWRSLRNYRRRAHEPSSLTEITIGVPHWLVAAPFGIAPALWAVRKGRERRRGRRVRRGLCPACGYDLRASSGACPECGTPVAAGANPSA